MFCNNEEVSHLLLNLQKPVVQITSLASSIAPSITVLFNDSIQMGRIPDQFLNLLMCLSLLTTGLFPLTCTLCKLLEKHIVSFMCEHLLTFNYLSTYQWGVVKKWSTVGALLSITQDWISIIESGMEVTAVFFDFQKCLIVYHTYH